MPLAGTREILYRAMEGKYAVGAFNVSSLELIKPIVEAAEAERAPVILQMTAAQYEYMGLHLAAAAARAAADAAGVPVAIHLDHGATYAQNVAALRAGFTSLMMDASSKPFEENVRLSRQIVELGHAVGIGVEAELGRVLRAANAPQADDIKACFTDPGEAADFIAATDADFLAVAVGTVHNMVKRSAEIDLPRIAAIRERVRRPLVLHGGSGVPHEVLAEAVANGICKVNVATELLKQLRQGVEKAYAAQPGELQPRVMMPGVMAVVRDTVAEKIRLFGSAGKA